MSFEPQLFIGRLSSVTPQYDNIVAILGDTVNGLPTITNVAPFNAAQDITLLRVGQTINTVTGGGFSSNVIITNIAGSTLTVDINAVASQTGGIFTADTPAGIYFFNSASFLDPQSVLTVNDITGSNDADYNPTLTPEYAIIGQASNTLGGSAINAKFHLYKITDVTYRDLGTSKISGYIAWAEQGTEADSGNFLFAQTNQVLAIGALSPSSSNVTIYDNAAITSTPAGSSVAGYQIALPSIIDQSATGSVGVNFPYTGSAEITGSLGVTGSSEFLINSSENFIIKNASSPTQSLFNINQDGVAVFRAREGVDGVPTAIVGGLYFTTSSAYIGVN
jgi:hypothetical protein